MATATTDTLTASGVGPMRGEISVPLSREGGIVVLRGTNGAGKTSLLDAIDTIIEGKGQISVNDHCKKAIVEAFGRTITKSGRMSFIGDLECSAYAGGSDLGDLISPKYKDAATRDKERIKRLVSLTKAKADVGLFFDPADTEMLAVVDPEALNRDDLVEMAAQVKRELEKAARSEEAAKEREQGHALGCRGAVTEGLDLSTAADAEGLQEALRVATVAQSQLQQHRENAERAKREARLAQDHLDEQCEAAGTVTVEQAEKSYKLAMQAHAGKTTLVAEAQRALDEAKHAEELAGELAMSANERLLAAKNHAATVSKWQATIDAAANVVNPSDEDLARADAAYEAAKTASDAGAAVRAALTQIEKAKEHDEAAKNHAKRALRFRDAAAFTEQVLSESIKCEAVQVKDGRLITETDRGETFFDELSEGQKGLIVIPLAANELRKVDATRPAVMTLNQECWQGIAPAAQKQLNAMAKKLRITIVAGEVADGPLRVIPFGGVDSWTPEAVGE